MANFSIFVAKFGDFLWQNLAKFGISNGNFPRCQNNGGAIRNIGPQDKCVVSGRTGMCVEGVGLALLFNMSVITQSAYSGFLY